MSKLISGIWYFNEVLTTLLDGKYEQVNFSTQGVLDGTQIDIYFVARIMRIDYINSAGGITEVYQAGTGWTNEGYRTVDFGSTPQSVSDEFYAWLTANATKSGLSSLKTVTENIKKYVDSKDADIKESVNSKVAAGAQSIDTSIAQIKDVPSDSAKYAGINKIGGMTYKIYEVSGVWVFNESAPYSDERIEQSVNFSFEDEGTVVNCNLMTIDGNSLAYEPYTTEQDGTPAYDSSWVLSRTVDFGSTPQQVSEEFYNWLSANAVIQDGIGARLESAKVTEMKSVGVNLFDYASYLKNGKKYSFSVIPNKMLYRNAEIGNSGGWGVYDNSGVLLGTFTTYNFTVTNPLRLPSNASYIECTDVALFESLYIGYDSDTTYRPYKESTLSIPEAVQALDGYGWGINADCYNYVDLEKKQFVKRVEKIVFDGSDDEGWTANGSPDNLFYISTPFIRTSRTLCDKLPTNTFLVVAKDGLYTSPEFSVLYLNLPSVSSIENSVYYLRAWLAENQLTVIGELAEPVITDISDLLPEDNFIEVEGNGSITAVNEYGYDVPSEIVFNIKNNEQVNANTFVGDLIGKAQSAERDGAGRLLEDTYMSYSYDKVYTGETAAVSEFYSGPIDYRIQEQLDTLENEIGTQESIVVDCKSTLNEHTDQLFSHTTELADHESRITALELNYCLVAGTPILMADGTTKPIEEVQYGDMIMSWDVENSCRIKSKAYASVCTGYADKVTLMYFDNGGLLECHGDHVIYNVEYQRPSHLKSWKIDQHSLTPTGEQIAYSGKAVIDLVKPPLKYQLYSDTGLYFANDILCGHGLGAILRAYYRAPKAFRLTEEDVAEITEYAEEEDNRLYARTRGDVEFRKEVASLRRQLSLTSATMDSCKKELAKRDYKTIKAAQGALSEEDSMLNKAECENLRAQFAVAEEERKKVLDEISTIRAKYGYEHDRPYAEMRTAQMKKACAKAHERYGEV